MVPTDRLPLRVTNLLKIPQQMGRWAMQPGETIDVPMAFLEQFGSAQGIHVDFGGIQHTLRTNDEIGRLTFDFWCPLSSIDGYGRHALAIADGLRRLGVNPVLQDAEWRETASGDHPHLNPGITAEARRNRALPPTRIGLSMTVPYDAILHGHQSIYKIAITQFETDTVPSFHVRQANRVDHLILTSHFQPEVWRRSGLRRDLPVSVLTPGVDADFFSFRERPKGDAFKVLILGALTARKDPVTAVRAFQEASNGDESWRLTIKTRRADGLEILLRRLGFQFRSERDENGHEVHHIKYPLHAPAPVDPRIDVWLCDDSPERVRQRYWEHDCLLWPSKGEGVGLPPLEAMATGMDVVMSNNSGMADYAFPEHCWPVGTSHIEPADVPGGFSRRYVETYGDVGSWWVPDYDQLVKQLRRAHEAWGRGKGKGVKAAQYVREHHSLGHQAQSVLEVVQKYA